MEYYYSRTDVYDMEIEIVTFAVNDITYHAQLDVAQQRKLQKYGFFCTKLRLPPFSAASMGCTQRVPKPDMHGMERLELNYGVKVSYKLNSAILQSRTDVVPMFRQRLHSPSPVI